MCVSYPGISSIGYLPVLSLPANTAYWAVAGVPVGLYEYPTPIPLTDVPELLVETSNENNGSAESVTLTFKTTLELPRHKPVAFVIKDANNALWLVGQLESPNLSITGTKNTGAPGGEPAVITYEVKQTAPKCLKPCKMML